MAAAQASSAGSPTSGSATGRRSAARAAAWASCKRAGIAVPPGFVVETGAFEHFLAALEREAPVRAAVEALTADDLEGSHELLAGSCAPLGERAAAAGDRSAS